MKGKYSTGDSYESQTASNKTLLQAVFDTVLNGIHVLEAIRNEREGITDFRIVMINDAASKFPGKQNPANTLFLGEFPGSRKSGLFQKLVNVVETGLALDEIFYYPFEGLNHWLHIKAQKFNDGVVASREDITERMLAEKRVLEQSHFIEQIANMTPDIIQVVDIEKQEVIYANRIIYEDLGYTAYEIAELTLKGILSLHHPDDRERLLAFRESFKSASENEVKEYEGRILSKDGSWIWFTSRGRVFKRNDNNHVTQYIMVSRNITKYKNIEEELKISTRFLEHIAYTVPDIITVFSLSTNKIIYANRHQLEQWGYTPEQMFNLDNEERLDKIIHPDDRQAGRKFLHDRNLLQNGEIIEIEQRIKTGNNEWQWYCTRSKVFTRDAEGNAAQIISFSYNINKQKLAEEEIHSLYKELVIKNRELESLNYELNTFTNIVANDYKETFRNLYTLLEFTISRDANNLTDAGKANLRRIQAGVQKIKLLTEDIITYSSVHTSGENVNVDMNLVIKHVENELKREIFETGATIQHTELPFVSGQPQLISLLFRHLIANAIKFSSHERKAVITISHSTVNGSDLHYNSVMKDIQYTVLSISDNGIGFEPQYAKDIFKMFFKIHEKGKYKGSGIGLAVCNKIIEIHHGFINAESIPLEGTTINCYFPVQKIKAASS